MAEEKGKKITKVKKKRWIEVLSSALFKNELIGEIPLSESKLAVGRAISVNLMGLTRDIKKQNTQIKFIINDIKGDKATTELNGYYLNTTSTKRLVRKGKEKVAFSGIFKTSDNKKVRIMPLMILSTKIKGSVATTLRKNASDYLTSYTAKTTFEDIIKDLIINKLQKDLKVALKKVYPVRVLEIAKVHLETEKRPVEKKIKEEEIKEEVEKEETGEVVEEKSEEAKEEVKEEEPQSKEKEEPEVIEEE